MKIAIGSTQEAKFSAVYEAAKLHYGPGHLECTGCSVNSGVPDQPFTLEQIYIGAANRAHRALKNEPNADIGVGLEGGLQRVGDKLIDFGLVQIVGRNGLSGIGITEGIPLPDAVSAMILDEGVELSDAVSRIYNLDTLKTRDCTGIFTNGRLGVTKFYISAVRTALEDYDRQVA